MISPIALVEATWPPARHWQTGPWTIRDGAGGGKRVSAATAGSAVTAADLPVAEAEMTALGQTPLFMIRDGDEALDALLEAEGYGIVDPTALYDAPVRALSQPPPPRLSTFPIYPPLAIMADLWAEGGIGSSRLAVMDRVTGPKTAILARNNDQPAGTAFVALAGGSAMIHAIEVTALQRRAGVGTNILRAAAIWAQDQGAERLALAVTVSNAAANALYTSLGMQIVGHYHYRIKQG